MNTNRIISLLIVAVSIVIFIYAFAGSSQERDEYAQKINAEREQKNRKFRTARNVSPLTEAEKKTFTGLKYFEPNQDYKVMAKLEKLEDDSIYAFRTSKKTARRMKKYGVITFQLKEQKHELVVLRGLDPISGKMLFLPFTDETSGAETYGAGRYIDLPVPETNQITVDFNQAYNPYCSYNESYECPLPPAENHLKIKVEAGEKNFK